MILHLIKKQLGYWLSIFLLLGLTISCEDELEVDLPPTQLTGEAVFENMQTAEAALADLYAKLRDNTLITGEANGLSVRLGYYSDELDLYDFSRTDLSPFYQNNLLASSNSLKQFWNENYHLIYAANAIIERSDSSSSLNGEEKSKLKGEALFVRALVHFYLVNLFGEIPYVTTTDYRTNAQLERLQKSLVYDHLIQDLLLAKNNLGETDPTGERTRPNRHVAGALLARVYLYQEQWSLAEQQATEVLTGYTGLVWQNDLQQVFKKEATTTIWQLKPYADGINTYEAQNFIFLQAPPPTGSLNPTMAEAFSLEDLRYTQWVGTVNENNQVYYYPFKYQQQNNTESSQEYPIVLRMAELYLIKSEALAKQGNLQEAYENLEKTRARAGLSPLEQNGENDLMIALEEERKKELFTEYGHRFFDLKRWNRLDAVFSNQKPGWNNYNSLWPIPQDELLLNPALGQQNPGY